MRRRTDLLIYGAGCHGRVVLDAALRCPGLRVVGLLDDDPHLHGRSIYGIEVIGDASWLSHSRYLRCRVVVAVGDAAARREVVERLTRLGASFASVVHPTAFLARGTAVGEGTMLLPMAVVHTDATIGRHVIVNTGAVIEHNCILEDYVHVSSGARLAGGVRVGEGALVGIGASVVPGVQIGAGAIVGAGAAVVGDVRGGDVVGGVPAKRLERGSVR